MRFQKTSVALYWEDLTDKAKKRILDKLDEDTTPHPYLPIAYIEEIMELHFDK